MTRTLNHRLVVGLAALLVIVALTAVAGPVVAADPTVTVTDGSTTVGTNTTLAVVLTDAPDGLTGYRLTVDRSASGPVRIVGASYAEGFGLTESPVLRDGSVTLEAADTSDTVKSGARNVTLARLTVVGRQPGSATLSVEIEQIDADDGSAISPETASGTVRVTPAGKSTTDATVTTDESTAGTTNRSQPTTTAGPVPMLWAPLAVVIVTGLLARRSSPDGQSAADHTSQP